VIRTGERAPDFSAPATDGRTLRLSNLRGHNVVLYFFPKAFTKG
jgi:peroxiredoxin Q/BCP